MEKHSHIPPTAANVLPNWYGKDMEDELARLELSMNEEMVSQRRYVTHSTVLSLLNKQKIWSCKINMKICMLIDVWCVWSCFYIPLELQFFNTTYHNRIVLRISLKKQLLQKPKQFFSSITCKYKRRIQRLIPFKFASCKAIVSRSSQLQILQKSPIFPTLNCLYIFIYIPPTLMKCFPPNMQPS